MRWTGGGGSCSVVAFSGNLFFKLLTFATNITKEQEAQLPQRNSARQLPTWRGLGPQPPQPYAPSGYTYAWSNGRTRNPQQTYVKRAVHQAHFKMNRAFKVILGHPYWCQQESRTVCCRNVQFMPTLFLKQRENGKFVDFNDPSQVWRRPSKKRLRISTNDLYSQKNRVIDLYYCPYSMGKYMIMMMMMIYIH